MCVGLCVCVCAIVCCLCVFTCVSYLHPALGNCVENIFPLKCMSTRIMITIVNLPVLLYGVCQHTRAEHMDCFHVLCVCVLVVRICV